MQSLQTMSKPPSQSSANLPPLQNLPSWSRSSLERRRPPRPIVRDKLQPVQSIMTEHFAHENLSAGDLDEKANLRIVSAPSGGHDVDPHQRVIHMQKSIEFLRSEQSDILERLHAEIDRLRAENKELNFKLVMARSGVSLHKANSPLPDEEDISDTNASKDTEPLDDHTGQKDKEKDPTGERCNSSKQSMQPNKGQPSDKKAAIVKAPSSATAKSATEKSRPSAKTKSKQSKDQDKHSASLKTPASRRTARIVKQEVSIPGRQSVVMVTVKDKSIRVHVPSEAAPRSPTLSECKAIIKHQQDANEQQAQELSKLRTDLKDAMVSTKWKSEAFLSAKAYRGEERHEPVTNREQASLAKGLPRLPVREQPERLAARMRTGQESVSLPVLRPNNMSNFADRKRRQQAALRARGARRDYY